ncbi:uncharacterized protein NECHADRAFT_85638 [Fusarium vanettenii 77-13-4]|uniref:Uncharacterized protein n=1 Tax=Fusarium vanettenii (strain ATCC MYA-4622 / CBS 123669 / FGSC 9596 / NRRL 45880 / 77-13-4) TaxID=660122 RepID=C7ZP92_FUSV7|nr:uncharacterized protein NECHADRAFT_85638 [Fusarium vanettenii 77-13-4]EEU34306.1 predicted protein [Fusarium vanettenii 77-13-4]
MGRLRDVIGHHSCDASVERPRVRYWVHQVGYTPQPYLGGKDKSMPRHRCLCRVCLSVNYSAWFKDRSPTIDFNPGYFKTSPNETPRFRCTLTNNVHSNTKKVSVILTEHRAPQTHTRSPSGTSPWENKQPSEQEYKQRIQDWLSDPGLDIQGRLLSGRSRRSTPPRGVRQEGEAVGRKVRQAVL